MKTLDELDRLHAAATARAQTLEAVLRELDAPDEEEP